MTTNTADSFKRPFPALTPAQRYHFDVYGYVVVENTLTAEETSSVLNALQSLKREFEATGDPTGTTIRNCRVSPATRRPTCTSPTSSRPILPFSPT